MEKLIEKLDKITDNKTPFNDWSLNEIKQLLDIYFIISKKETHIFELIYSYHGCDSWEDIFRDYNIRYLEDKSDGVEIAIKEVIEQIEKYSRCEAVGIRSNSRERSSSEFDRENPK